MKWVKSYNFIVEANLVRLSKFLSRVLRHQPGMLGLRLDSGGWVVVGVLLNAMQQRGMTIDRALLERVVAENDKQRFSFSADGARIRANQGHSIDVDLGLEARTPPDMLYHGTAARNLEAILSQGLLKGRRHAVHLSLDDKTARIVGQRHGAPVVLVIDSARMAADGYAFTCSANGVWLTDHVPPEYIRQEK